ncbi:hypothetical protein cyc_03514 [Cyclospora cayetanensis]|uniref:Uncharacterized protein n=1 Tax=Cyclospora cayetanensis TaxID=88456 RepID=A0A1D3CRT3_9EIME|nr:hypothetical protein cyc_03514 [Cyclospora cayetanensis]
MSNTDDRGDTLCDLHIHGNVILGRTSCVLNPEAYMLQQTLVIRTTPAEAPPLLALATSWLRVENKKAKTRLEKNPGRYREAWPQRLPPSASTLQNQHPPKVGSEVQLLRSQLRAEQGEREAGGAA